MVTKSVTLYGRARALAKSPQFWRLVRYGTVSVISTILTLGLIYIFFDLAKFSVTTANILATAIATIPAYFLTRNWTWGKSGPSHLWREVVPFWVIAVVGLVASTYAVRFGDRVAKSVSHAHIVETIFVLGANFITYGIIWVVKFILFNKVLFVNPIEGVAEDPGLPLSSS